MKRTAKSKFLFVSLFIVSSLLLSSCAGGFISPNSGGSKDSEEYVKGAVVKNFPAIALYPKAVPVESYSNDGRFGASFISEDELAKVSTFYQSNLKQGGWEVTSKMQSDSNYLFEIKNEKYKGILIINTASDGKKTAITMSLEERI